jgi:O-antigen/teichoic acid export membrane protein
VVLRRNLIANFTGAAWTAVLSFAVVPIYIRLLGVEAYALVGLQLTMQAMFFVLDLGLSTTISREVARLHHEPANAPRIRELVFTLEVLYWLAALVVAAAIALLAAPITDRWVHTVTLSRSTVIATMRLIGVVIAMQFPFAFYSGALFGLQRHVAMNALTMTWATIRAAGAIAVLMFVSHSVDIFFKWQAAVSVGQALAAAIVLWVLLPKGAGRPFRLSALRGIARVAAGLAVVTIMGTLLSQMDKVVLSRVLTLKGFGYYTIASMVASALWIGVGPIFTSILPRFAQLIAAGDEIELRLTYHRSAQAMSVVIIPATMMLVFFAPQLLLAWTRNASVAANGHLAVSLLAIGFGLGAINQVPYAMQIAAGWVRLPLVQNVVAVCSLVPVMIWASRQFGVAGAASVWVALNAGYVVSNAIIMFTRLLRGQRTAWLMRDIGPPLATSVMIAIPARLLMAAPLPPLQSIVTLAAIGLMMVAAATAVTPYSREFVSESARYLRSAMARR